MPDFDNVRPLAAAEIVSRDSRLQLEISHDLPALLGEWYPIRMILVNKEDNRITGITAHVNLQMNGDESSIEQASKLCYKVAWERTINEEIRIKIYQLLLLTRKNSFDLPSSGTGGIQTVRCLWPVTDIS